MSLSPALIIYASEHLKDLPPWPTNLNVIELLLFHGLELWYLCIHPLQVVLYSIVCVPTDVLSKVRNCLRGRNSASLTSGDEIFTLRTFSSIMRRSSHHDSIKSVWHTSDTRSVVSKVHLLGCRASGIPWQGSAGQKPLDSPHRKWRSAHFHDQRTGRYLHDTCVRSFGVIKQT